SLCRGSRQRAGSGGWRSPLNRPCPPIPSPAGEGDASRRHAVVAQQGVEAGLAAAEGLEVLQRAAAAAAGKDLAQEAGAGFGQLPGGFLERGIGVGAEHLGPLVAVVAGRVVAGEDVVELVRETVPRRGA